MKRLLLFSTLLLFQMNFLFAQCPDGDNTDSDGDGVADCIDPCVNNATSIAGNLSFESELLGWTVPQNQENFAVSDDTANALHGTKSLVVTAPNASIFENHAIESESFVLKPDIAYTLKINVKKNTTTDGDAIRWALVDENGRYRYLNNYYTTTEDWTQVGFNNLVINFDVFPSNVFKLRMEFGLSTVDMVVDKIELFESQQGSDATYQDINLDGLPDCGAIDFSNHPDYDALVALYNSTNGDNWSINTNWLNTEVSLGDWHGVVLVDNRVTELRLGGNNLTGSLPSEIGNLPQLTLIELPFNNLEGIIPVEMESLSRMNFIDFRDNQMFGTVPAGFSNFSDLSIFVISGNFFEGKLPDFTGNLSSNDFLWFENNKFQFGDFDEEFTSYQNIINFLYTPQKPLDPKPNIKTTIGEEVSISANVSGIDNNYSWFKRNADASTEFINNQETLMLSIESEADFGDYFLQVSNNTVTDLTLISPDFSIVEDSTASPDYDALVDFYNSTNGDDWRNNSNWLDETKPLSQWFGLTVVNNRVVGIELRNNQLSGILSEGLGNLSDLERLNVSSNTISGTIPNLSVASKLISFNCNLNDFEFIDFEPNFERNSTIETFFYSVQNDRDDAIEINAALGSDYSFAMTPIEGTNISYQWFRVNKSFSDANISISGATTNTLNIVNTQAEDLDAYSCFATSSIIPDLIIKRSIAELKGAVSQLERDALIAIYDATGGSTSWIGMTNWNTDTPVSTWKGVSTTGNKVISLALQSFNPVGQLPEELGGLIHLEQLFIGLGDLNLTGPIPASIGNLTKLRKFWIQGTGMSGEIPASIGNLINLFEIRLLGNNFTGVLPASMSNLNKLESVGLTGNEVLGKRSSFSGAIPFNSPIANIALSENQYDFSDIEPFVQAGNFKSFVYSPQNTNDIAQTIESGFGADITLNVNDTNLNRTSAPTAMNNEYQWYKDNVKIAGATGASFTIVDAQVTDSGVYYCEITNSILPDLVIVRAPITIVIDGTLGDSIISTDKISIYPNPAANWLTIKSFNLQDAKVKIFDINGRLIVSEILNGNSNSLNVENLQTGTYILKIEDKNKVQTKRFVKQ